jgi:ferredoxin-nitrite reductase
VLELRWGRSLQRAGRDMRLPDHVDHLGVHEQKQPGLLSVGLCVPAGRVRSEQLAGLALLADAHGSGEVRLTPSQNAIIVNVPEAALPALLEEPLLRELSPSPSPFTRGLVSCTGTDYCNLALIETKGLGKRLADVLAERFPNVEPLTMHWSGCPAGCGNHQAADIGFQGAKARVNGEIVDAVSIFVGGRTGADARPGEKLIELVPVSLLEDVVPMVIENLRVLKEVRKTPEAGERVLMVPAFA